MPAPRKKNRFSQTIERIKGAVKAFAGVSAKVSTLLDNKPGVVTLARQFDELSRQSNRVVYDVRQATTAMQGELIGRVRNIIEANDPMAFERLCERMTRGRDDPRYGPARAMQWLNELNSFDATGISMSGSYRQEQGCVVACPVEFIANGDWKMFHQAAAVATPPRHSI